MYKLDLLKRMENMILKLLCFANQYLLWKYTAVK